MKKAVIIILVVLAVGAVVVFGGQRIAAGAQATPTSQPTVAPVKSSSNIIAEGKVVPTQDASLSFTTAGVISEVLIKEGQKVEKGQVLARLTGSKQLQAAIKGAELEVLSAQQDLTRLKDNAALTTAQAQLAVAQAQKAYDDAQKHRLNLDYRSTPSQIAAANANYILAQNEVDKFQERYDNVSHRAENDATRALALANLENAKKARDKALINLNWYKGKADPKDIAEADASLSVAQAKLEDARTQLEKVKNGPDADQLALIQSQLDSAQAKAEAARASLTDLELSAPFDGTINSIDMAVGQFIQPGAAVVKLADLSTWLVKTTDLTELNVAKIQPGMTAEVKLDALPDATMNGKVMYVENFGQNHQSDIVYTVVLQLEKPDPRLRWNMTAVVTFPEK
ncbi:MAG TPA: efflux RND transporter periplasmic adaptor subunit [Anaerolineaceae bacterium]|nr:efflux RND transporter periplasmic adaptor subunit [Anaerolineaceae bacterium]